MVMDPVFADTMNLLPSQTRKTDDPTPARSVSLLPWDVEFETAKAGKPTDSADPVRM